MKKRAAVLVTAAALVLSLAACGDQSNHANGNGNTHDGGTSQGSGTQNGDGDTHAGGAGDARGRGTLGGDIRDAVDGAIDDVTGQRQVGGMTSFQRMLDNARVHDVDGVLTDGENSSW